MVTDKINIRDTFLPDVLIIDPPWPKKKGGKRRVRPKQGKKLDYNTLSVAEIFNLLDREIFPRKQHTVFMWTIDEFLVECEKQMSERSYRRHARLIWNKTNGIAPAFSVRFAHEYLIWYYKPKFIKIHNTARGLFTTVFTEKAREHSRKPDIIYLMIQALYPHAKKLDVFSREERIGWDTWGNERDKFNKK